MPTQQRQQQTKLRQLMINVGGILVNKLALLFPMGVMALVMVPTLGIFWEEWKLKVSEYMVGLYYVP